MDGRNYPSDLTDEQWQLIEPLLPPPSRVGRPRRICRRQVVNAILYVNRTGCSVRRANADKCFRKLSFIFCSLFRCHSGRQANDSRSPHRGAHASTRSLRESKNVTSASGNRAAITLPSAHVKPDRSVI